MLSGERIAVIGAGVAGCMVARNLADKGARLEVFDKSRGTGGRLAASRLGDVSADLGADVFDESTAMRLMRVESLPLQLWSHTRADLQLQSRTRADAWVSAPRASALTRQLLDGIPLHGQTRITELKPAEQDCWWLQDESGRYWGPYNRVIIAVPAPQAVPLLAGAPDLQSAAAAVRMSSAWVLLLALSQRPRVLQAVDLLEGEHSVLSRVCRDSGKPGRSGEVWQLRARADWSDRHVDANPEYVAQQLLDAFVDLVEEPVQVARHRIHRWLYADVATSSGSPPLCGTGRLGVCGDWVCGQGLSAAMQSADLLTRALEADQ
ncbi:FAD-dependent oxidoreductase [Marinobacterium maritimum]|uniref:FAD-dependent oxidoreductase n=2 Tax=Marinobacterium maritimum TaxID=500162 RepID=A0ABN1I4Q9_9GAMM